MIKVSLPCGRSFIIDENDLSVLKGFRPHSEARGRTRYIRLRRRGQSKGGIYLHNLIIGGRADHIDGDGLNNSRLNLRPCTQAQNGLNRSAKLGKRFKGVYRSRSGKFYAQIYINRKAHTVHGFATEELAAREYDRLAASLHGEWARLNFPNDTPATPDFRWLDRNDWRQPEFAL
ncbi:hypothetical protein [Roseinatronobacter sp. NSM]|uniref:hypothetical protein n=1 Tax=Roseinatronobacter sp. NSM TaxID=3457785 RepID=UPI0040363028